MGLEIRDLCAGMSPNGCVVLGSTGFIAPLLSPTVYRLDPSGERFDFVTIQPLP